MSGSSSIGNSLAPEVAKALREWEGRSQALAARAKVNLRLKVEGRRSDGYHLLSMLNCSLSLSDTVTVSFTAESSCSVRVEPVGILPEVGSDNLVVKAFRAYWREFGFSNPPLGMDVVINKRIPIGGGLGGGSADAGAILRHLTTVFGASLKAASDLSDEEYNGRVMRAALTCGADVPYATVGGLCCVRGIGEQVAPVNRQIVAPSQVLIMVPSAPVPTAVFYEHYRKRYPSIEPSTDRALVEFVGGGGGSLTDLVENDFEETACQIVPEIGEGLRLAREVFPQGTALTGSGSVFFSLIPEGQGGAISELTARLKTLGITTHLSSLIFL